MQLCRTDALKRLAFDLRLSDARVIGSVMGDPKVFVILAVCENRWVPALKTWPDFVIVTELLHI